MSNSVSLLDRMLQPGALEVGFHPVLETSGAKPRLQVLECLIRGPVDTSIADPGLLFEYARQRQAETLIDRACLTAIFQTLGEVDCDFTWAVNVQNATMGREVDLADFLLSLAGISHIAPGRLIVEITEQTMPPDRLVFERVLAQLRERGVRIALSGFGGRQANFLLLMQSRPDFLKLDRSLIRGCGTDRQRWLVVDSLARLAESLGVKVIAQGIETGSDFKAARDAGISLMQGFLFSRVLSADELCQYNPGYTRGMT